jgi:hypothetical protein
LNGGKFIHGNSIIDQQTAAFVCAQISSEKKQLPLWRLITIGRLIEFSSPPSAELTLSEFDDPPSGISTINNQHYQFHNNDYDNEHGFPSETEGVDENVNALNRGPYFDVSATKNVTALVGNTAYLNCRVRNLGNKTVRTARELEGK